MTHSYHFELYKNPTSTPVYFSYEGETVIPNAVIKDIVTNLVIHATNLWLKNQCVDDVINMVEFKRLLEADHRNDLVEWLVPYNELTMRNGNPEREQYDNIYVHLH